MTDTKQTLIPRLVQEDTFVEGNLLEYPLFRLSNKDLKPKRENGLVDPADYVTDYFAETTVAPGLQRTRKLSMKASVHYGYPGMFAFGVLLAVMKKAQDTKAPTRRVAITRPEICQALDIDRGGTQLRAIDAALGALKNTELTFFDSWHDGHTRAAHPGIHIEHLVTDFQFRPSPRDKAAKVPAQLAFNYAEFVELGAGLWSNLQAGYKILVDLHYLNHLPTDTAKRLYDYLTKRDGKDETPRMAYTENLQMLGAKLPLTKTSPSAIRSHLQPALEVLKTPLAPTGKRFLSDYKFEGSRSESRLTVYFARAASSSIRDSVRQLAASQKRS